MAAKKKTQQEKIAEALETKKAEEAQNETPKPTPKTVDNDLTGEWDIDSWERASVEIWRPEEGEAVIGTYHDSTIFEGDFDEPCKCHRIKERTTGAIISFVGGKMCDKFIEDAGIDTGYKVFVKYLGQGETNKGNRVNNFDIRYQK